MAGVALRVGSGPTPTEVTTCAAGERQNGAMELIDRVRAQLPTAEEKRMFGGTGFMVDGALACSVSARGLLVRVGPEHQGDLSAPRVWSRWSREVAPAAAGCTCRPHVVDDDAALREWLERGVAAARASLRQAP